MSPHEPLFPPPVPPEDSADRESPGAAFEQDFPIEPPADAKAWIVAAHLLPLACYPLYWVPGSGVALIAPLVIARLRGDVHPLVADQGREAFQFHLAAAALVFVLGLTIVGWFLAWVAVAVAFLMSILAAARACSGEEYRYPWIPRLLD